MEQKEISASPEEGRMQRAPCVRVLAPGSSLPHRCGRKAERAAEVNGDRPLAAQR